MNFYKSLLETYNAGGVVFAMVIWIIMLIVLKPGITFNSPLKNSTSKGVNMFVFLFYIVCVLGLHRWDTYHIEAVESGIYDHLEPLHEWLYVCLSNGNRFWYRIIVFGGASYIMMHIAKYLKIYNRNFAIVCTLCIVDSMFCEMRGTIGHVILLWGYILLIDSSIKQHQVYNRIIGALLICLSFFLHRSIFICIIFACLSLFDFAKKYIIVISWLLFPVFVLLINSYFPYMLDSFSTFDHGNMGVAESIDFYGNSDYSVGQYNLVGLIITGITNASIYLIFIYTTIRIVFHNIRVDSIYKYLFRWYYICMYVGLVLSFADVNDWLNRRIMAMALYPMPFVLARVWNEEKRSSIWTKMIILFGILGVILSFLIRYRDWV